MQILEVRVDFDVVWVLLMYSSGFWEGLLGVRVSGQVGVVRRVSNSGLWFVEKGRLAGSFAAFLG